MLNIRPPLKIEKLRMTSVPSPMMMPKKIRPGSVLG
jgi:hypothetical protein